MFSLRSLSWLLDYFKQWQGQTKSHIILKKYTVGILITDSTGTGMVNSSPLAE